MSVTTSNFHFPSNEWCNRATSMMIMAATASSESVNTGSSPNVDDGLTSLSWLQNLNMCMTRLGAPTPPTPPASPICSGSNSTNNNNVNTNNINNHKNNNINNITVSLSSTVEGVHNTNMHKIHSLFQNQRDHRSYTNVNATNGKKSSHSNENEIVDYKTNGNVKPPYSYATLICMAMKANKNKMTLSAIYKWIRENFMYYKNADPSWQNSIRHNLSLNKCFIKIPRNKDEPGKGGFWRLDPIYADTLVDGVFKKRRPSQRGSTSSNSSNTSAPFRKKSRKKEPIRNDSSLSTSINGSKNVTSNGIETTISHDTPPNSTESYNLYGEPPNDVVELVTAVSSIESVGHCPSYSYTMHTTHSDCESHLSHQGYADEVCITEAASDACMLGTDGNDICWNAILTDADLNELVDPVSYTGPVIQTADSNITLSDSTTTTTAQLTAVEPHSLRLVASSSPVTTVLEESELFQNGIARHINCLAINNRSNIGSDVISATHNVVTCVNPTNVSTNDWNSWPTFSTVTAHDNQNSSTDLLIRQINGNCEPIVSGIVSASPPITYITTTAATIASRQTNGSKQINCLNNQQNINSNSASSTQPSSPTSGNYDPNSLQPWAECKAALEAAALDLESFGSLDVVHHY